MIERNHFNSEYQSIFFWIINVCLISWEKLFLLVDLIYVQFKIVVNTKNANLGVSVLMLSLLMDLSSNFFYTKSLLNLTFVLRQDWTLILINSFSVSFNKIVRGLQNKIGAWFNKIKKNYSQYLNSWLWISRSYFIFS